VGFDSLMSFSESTTEMVLYFIVVLMTLESHPSRMGRLLETNNKTDFVAISVAISHLVALSWS
jgi:hypothetical protein